MNTIRNTFRFFLLILKTTHREAVRAARVALRTDEGRIEDHVVGVTHIRVRTRRPVATVGSDIAGGSIGVIAEASRRELKQVGTSERGLCCSTECIENVLSFSGRRHVSSAGTRSLSTLRISSE
jgi:hypothetical protein